MNFFNAYRKYMLMEEAAPPEGGKPVGTKPAEPSAEIETLRTQNADLMKRLEAMESRFKNEPPQKDLSDIAKQKREADEKKSQDHKKIAGAVKFTMGAPEWLKNNAALLPKTVPDIFVHAEKEKYGSEIEKADAIKVGVVSEFFAVQSNLDLLTESQKIILEDWKNLTKNDKQDRIQSVFDNVFEPTFEALRRIRKAEQLSKGHGDPTHSEDAYKEKMKALSRKHYLGEK